MNKNYTIRKWIQILVISAVFLATLVVGGNVFLSCNTMIKNDFIKMAEIATIHLDKVLEKNDGEWRFDEKSNKLYHGNDEIDVSVFDNVNEDKT